MTSTSRRIASSLVLGLLLLPACSPARGKGSPTPIKPGSDSLERIASDYWEEAMRSAPTWATDLGDRRYDDKLPDPSETGRAKHREMHRGLKARLDAVDRSTLDNAQRITVDVLDKELVDSIESEICKSWLWEVDALYGPHVYFPELASFHTIRTEQDLKNLATRYRAMKSWYGTVDENLRKGIGEGYVAPKLLVEKALRQLDEQLGRKVEQSPYLTVKLPAAWTKERQDAGRAELLAAVKEGVVPGLTAYRDFLRNELLPKARESVGVVANPDGAACYATMVRVHTGTNRTPDELHELGLREVQRLQSEMRAIIKRGRGGEDVSAWFAEAKKRPEMYLKTPEQLLEHNRKLVARAQAALPKAFGKLPKTPLEVKALEAFREKDAPAGYYYNAPKDGSRPAFYYVNTYDPGSRPLYNMAALAFHEGVPGHHLQIALAAENTSLTELQRQIGQSSFVEGWGLYSEGLAMELGLYASDAEKVGALNYECWRAVRLVVDTGMHTKGWPRAKALKYFLEFTGHTDMEAANEIDRYITWPGQALAYKVGQLEIRRMRAEAEKRLGPKFDLKEFHDHLLGNGSVPLTTAQREIDFWIIEREKAP